MLLLLFGDRLTRQTVNCKIFRRIFACLDFHNYKKLFVFGNNIDFTVRGKKILCADFVSVLFQKARGDLFAVSADVAGRFSKQHQSDSLSMNFKKVRLCRGQGPNSITRSRCSFVG